MQFATIVGQAIAPIKHASLTGWRVLVAQPESATGQRDGEPLLVIDHLGAAQGQRVLICNDGAGARELVGDKRSPVRWFVLGLCDA